MRISDWSSDVCSSDLTIEGEGAFLHGIHVGQVDAAGGEVAQDDAVAAVHDDDVVVLLEGERDLALRVDVHELGLGIPGRDVSEAGDVDLHQAGAVRHAAVQLQDGEVAGRHLRAGAVVPVFKIGRASVGERGWQYV